MLTTDGINFSARSAKDSGTGLAFAKEMFKITNKNKDVFTGAFWSGEKSLELGLIDDYGEMKSVLKQRFGENLKIREFAPKKKLFGFSNLFSGAIDIFINKIEERISFKKFGL